MERARHALNLMNEVYGAYTGATPWPKKLPAGESGQGRYLWVDAFGVLNYVGLASLNFEGRRDEYLSAANELVDVVHDTLGKPRSTKYPMRQDALSPTKYAGLRIGKLHALSGQTDFGMKYDGQYFHYVDKWLFSLLRLGQECGNYSRIHQAACWAKVLFPHFFDRAHGGIRWKLNVDSTPIRTGESATPNDDTLNALIIFMLIENATNMFLRGQINAEENSTQEVIHLTEEINLLTHSLKGYKPRVTADPLGWGLRCWMDQWIAPGKEQQLRKYAPITLNISHLSLPFRLYGALIGGQLLGIDVSALINASLEYEAKASSSSEVPEHSGINRVMLASALLSSGAPYVKREDEPTLSLE